MAKQKTPHTQTEQNTAPEQTDMESGEQPYESDSSADQNIYEQADGAETGTDRSARKVDTRNVRHRIEPETVAHEGSVSTRTPTSAAQGITSHSSAEETARQRKVVRDRPDAQAGVNHSKQVAATRPQISPSHSPFRPSQEPGESGGQSRQTSDAPMQTRANFLGHPIHQMLIVFPLGLLGTAAAFELAGGATRNRNLLNASYYMVRAGLVSAIGSAVPGTIDFLNLPRGTRARRIGLLHGLGNLLITGLFTANWLKRRRKPGKAVPSAIALSATGATLALVTEWLGGELVGRLGVGVHEDANPNAPNSLSNRSLRGLRPAA